MGRTMEFMAHRARYAAAMTAITRRLPFGLSEVVEPNMLGYLLINLCTFCVDLGLLGLLHGNNYNSHTISPLRMRFLLLVKAS